MSFLIVFRANHSYNRYQRTHLSVALLSHQLRDLVRIAIGYVQCTDDNGKRAMDVAAIHITRYVLGIAVTVISYCRMAEFQPPGSKRIPDKVKQLLDVDIKRLESLLLDDEFRYLSKTMGDFALREYFCCGRNKKWEQNDVPCLRYRRENGDDIESTTPILKESSAMGDPRNVFGGPKNVCNPLSILSVWLTRECASHCGRPNGYFERVLMLFDNRINNILTHFHHISDNIKLPFPGAFAQLCKLLLLFFLISAPFVVENEWKSFFSITAFPTLAAFAYLGIEQVAVGMEQPFTFVQGRDTDISIVEVFHEVEQHCMQILQQLGGVNVANAYEWVEAPSSYECQWYLRLRNETRRKLLDLTNVNRRLTMMGPLVRNPTMRSMEILKKLGSEDEAFVEVGDDEMVPYESHQSVIF